MSYQAEKVERGMKALEACPPPLAQAGDIHVGHIALACCLGYQDLRFEGTWRKSYPALVGWLDRFSELVPAFQETHVEA